MLKFVIMKEFKFDSIDILIYIVRQCASLGYDINITKGQKLLYCCYGAVLALLDARLCKEHPKAWQYGPAFPRAYKAHRNNTIEWNKPLKALSEEENKALVCILNETIKSFGKYSASTLVNWSHQSNSPWALCSNKGEFLYNDIDDCIIASYFAKNVVDKPQYEKAIKNKEE